MNYNYQQAVIKIEKAPLPAPVYRTARRLLDLARTSITPGYIEINHSQARDLAGTDSHGTMRSHLIALERYGIVKKWLNHSVRVWFNDYPPPPWLADAAEIDQSRALGDQSRANGQQPELSNREGSAEIDQSRALGDQSRALGDQSRALGDQSRAKNPTEISEILERERSNDLPTTEESLSLATSNDTNGTSPDLTDEQLRTLKLLIDPEVAMLHKNAEKVSSAFSFAFAVRMVASWWPHREKLTAAGLFYRFMHAKSFPPGVAGEEFLSSDFYRWHYPLDAAGIRARAYDPDPPPDPLLDALPVPLSEVMPP